MPEMTPEDIRILKEKGFSQDHIEYLYFESLDDESLEGASTVGFYEGSETTDYTKEILKEQIERWKQNSETLVKIKYEINNHKEAIVSYVLIDKLRRILRDAEREK